MSRRKYYNADDFMGKENRGDIKDVVEKKVSLLYDLCVLSEGNDGPDHREPALRNILTECGTEYRMTIALRDVIMGRKTLDELLTRKEVV